MKVYYRDSIDVIKVAGLQDRKTPLRSFDVATDDHVEAIVSIQQYLTENKENYKKPILAVINGGLV